jgi:two-component system, NtrC family, response regulator HydG
MPRVFVVEDEVDSREPLEDLLTREGLEVTCFHDPRAALEALVEAELDAVLVDVNMPEMGGAEFCERVIGARPDIPVLVFTGDGRMDTVIQAMRAGAFDFLTTPIDPRIVLLALRRAVERRGLVRELGRLRAASAVPLRTDGILGNSGAMRRALGLAQRVATSEANVVIHGETGTGKELVARSIHAASSRARGPFVAINCAAIQPNLLESELFGHARGAFTDAQENRRGLFLDATGGTLFLDEVGELPLDVQPKLLRALQERTIRPVGSNKELSYDARVISATNRVLEDEIVEGRFREDLYYRLNVVRIDLPPVRDRDADVPMLARHFLDRFATQQSRPPYTLTPAAISRLVAYGWPGNVREIENCMERAVALCRSSEVDEVDLPEKILAYRPTTFAVAADNEFEIVSIDELERTYTARVLALVSGNKSRAAQLLGIDRLTLYRKLDTWAARQSSDDAHRSAETPRSRS